MAPTADASASEFQRAKSFWQTRTARSQSQTQDNTASNATKCRSNTNAAAPVQDDPPAPATTTTAADAVKAATDMPKSFAKRIAPFSNATATASAAPLASANAATAGTTAAAPSGFRPSIAPAQSAASESPTTPAPDHMMPPTPLASIEPASKSTAKAASQSTFAASVPSMNVSATAASTVVTSVFKTLSDAKRFGAAKSRATSQSMRSLSFASISSSWKSMSQSSESSISSSSRSPKKSASPSAGASAKLNIHNPSHGATRTKTQSSALSTGSPYGELIVAEVLAARDLSVGDFIQGESDAFVVVRFDAKEKTSAVVKATLQPVYNERFVFWVPSSPAIDQHVVSVTVMNKNLVIPDEHLGEVHLSLAIPVNEAFDAWYPLVREDGSKRGSVRVGVRRMVLTSPSLLLAAQSLAAQDRSLTDADLAMHGSTIPELWYGFAEAQSPMAADESKLKQTDVLASKLNHFSRRFIGIELASDSSSARRDVF